MPRERASGERPSPALSPDDGGRGVEEESPSRSGEQCPPYGGRGEGCDDRSPRAGRWSWSYLPRPFPPPPLSVGGGVEPVLAEDRFLGRGGRGWGFLHAAGRGGFSPQGCFNQPAAWGISAGGVVLANRRGPAPLQGLCTLLAFAIAGIPAIESVWEKLRELRVDIDLLMLLGAGLAAVIGVRSRGRCCSFVRSFRGGWKGSRCGGREEGHHRTATTHSGGGDADRGKRNAAGSVAAAAASAIWYWFVRATRLRSTERS